MAGGVPVLKGRKGNALAVLVTDLIPYSGDGLLILLSHPLGGLRFLSEAT